ncbi:MAG: hypothetical protein PVH34_13070 [Syntrophobacterales bacterium]|jgi:hypothetical protein
MKTLLYTVSLAVLVLWLFFFTLSSPAPAQNIDLNRPLVASGTRPMLEQDSADARKLALEEALRAAVEQALGWLLPSDRIVRYYPLLLDHILKEPMSFIQDYQIVHEGVTFGLYRVTVLTTLYSEGLTRKLRRLGLFLAASERPRIALLVAERTSPEAPWHWWWQTSPLDHRQFIFSQALAKLMSDQGLVPLDPNLFLESLPEDPSYQEPVLNNEQGGALAKALGADVAMLGQVTHLPASADSTGMTSGSLRAVRVENGEILARVSGTVQVQPSGEYAASDYGFTALAERLAPHLVDGVLTPFVAVSRAPKEVTLQVEGVRSYGDLILIKEHLQRAPVVKEIRQIKLKADLGSFALVLAGTLEDLESALEGHDFGTFITSAEVTDENLIAVTILSKR